MKFKIIIFLNFLFSSVIFSQNGIVNVSVVDSKTGESIPFASVVVSRNGVNAHGGNTDIDGNCRVKNVSPGKYDLKVTSAGYTPFTLMGIVMDSSKTFTIKIQLEGAPYMLPEIEIVEYVVPLIDKNEPSPRKHKRWRIFRRKSDSLGND